MEFLTNLLISLPRSYNRFFSVRIFSILCFIILLLVLASCAFDTTWDIRTSQDEPLAQITLAWDPNTEPDLEGYKCYYGLNSMEYINTVFVGNNTVCTVTGLTPGETYYFAVTAYDIVGLESDYSEEIIYTVPTDLQ